MLLSLKKYSHSQLDEQLNTCYLFPRCGVKAKYVFFIENVFGSKDRVARRKHGEVLY
jgi:hypothetical protein